MQIEGRRAEPAAAARSRRATERPANPTPDVQVRVPEFNATDRSTPEIASMSWPRIVRLGLVQASIGGVVVMLTSIVNRVMIVELALPAVVPGLLVALHFAIQFALRPSFGHGSDRAGRREQWIVGGMVLLAVCGTGAAAGAAWIATDRALGLVVATLSFLGVGAGVSAAGTPLFAILAERVGPERRPRAAAVVLVVMIAGFIVTTAAASRFIAPFSWTRLVEATAAVGAIACAVTALAVRGIERGPAAGTRHVRERGTTAFRAALRAVLADPEARAFCWFMFLSMLAYSAQDLILEPFTGMAFGTTPAESTRISSMHRGGMLLGMLVTAGFAARSRTASRWASAGCALSAAFFVVLAWSPAAGSLALARLAVVGLGIGNGIFCIGALTTMMELGAAHVDGRSGLRMGVYGGVEAVAMGMAGLLGAGTFDVARSLLGSPTAGYVTVLAGEALVFAVAAVFALRSGAPEVAPVPELAHG